MLESSLFTKVTTRMLTLIGVGSGQVVTLDPISMVLPTEIVQIILDLLATELLDLTLEWTHQAWPSLQPAHDIYLRLLQATLYHCTLVSRAFHVLALPLLYTTVHLFTPNAVAAFRFSLKFQINHSNILPITSLNIYAKERFYQHKVKSSHLTLDLLNEILQIHGPNLRHLNLQGWHNVTPFNLIAAKCPNILHLDLIAIGSAIPHKTAQDFKKSGLATHCRNIMVLNLSWCGWIEFDQLSKLCELQELRALNLSSCESLKNDELRLFLPRLTKIEEIYLRGNNFIDFTTTGAILKGCPVIELLDFTGGFLLFDDSELEKLDKERPGCLILAGSVSSQ